MSIMCPTIHICEVIDIGKFITALFISLIEANIILIRLITSLTSKDEATTEINYIIKLDKNVIHVALKEIRYTTAIVLSVLVVVFRF